MPLFGPPNVKKMETKRDVKGLIKALGQKKDTRTRHDAAEALGQIGDARAVEPLIATLRDGDESVREAAAIALGKIGAPAVEPLIATLRDGDESVREAAAIALGKIGTPAVGPLSVALKDKNRAVREAAAKTLEAIGWQPSQDENGAAYWIARGKLARCVAIGAPAVEPLIATLRDGDESMRRAVVEALGQIGDARAVEPLIATLRDGDESVREAAAIALGKIGTPAVGPLSVALKDKNRAVREAAAKTLEAVGWQPSQDENGAAYWIARGELARCVAIGAPAVEPLIATLRYGDESMRRAVVEALGKIGTPAVGPLSAALKDKNRAVREAVVEALDRLSWQPDRSEAGAMYWIEKRQWDRCADIGSLAVAPLTRALENKDPEVRWAAARALGQIGDAQAAETLIAALKHEAAAFDKAAFDKATDTDAAFSQGPHLEAAMLAVSRISNIQAVEPLIAALLEEDSHVRLAAALALGSIGALRAVQPLETAHMNSRLRQSKALASLKEIEDLLNREKATVSRRDVAAQVHTLAAIYAVEWKAVELAAEVEDERVVQSSLEQALLEIRVRSIAALKDSENGSLTPSWYMAKSDRKHVRQVVVLIPPEKEVAPQVDNLVPPGALFGFMDAHWAAITLTMSSPDPGPFVFVRAEGVVEQLRHYPVRVAFSFYRMNAGGLFTVFVHVQCPSVEARTGNPAVFENTHDLDKEDARKLVEALIARDTIEICFTASGEKGPCTGYFGMVAPLPEDCRTALKAEWEQLLDYHKSVAVGRSFRERTVQMEQENPIQENPILDK